MKGPNPFAALEGGSDILSVRKDESRIFNGLLEATGAGQSSMILVKGGPGSGKSAMLSAFKEEAERNGMLSPYVKAERNEDIRAVAGKLCQDGALLAGTIAKEAPDGIIGLVRVLERMASKRHFGVIVFIDDLDIMRKAEEHLPQIWRTLGKSKVSFVVSITRGLKISLPENAKLMELRPLDEHDANEMVERALKKGPPKMGEECMNSIMTDTQGNPRLFRTACRFVYDKLRDNERVISKGHYLAYLPYIMSMLGREWFGRLYQEIPASEKAILAVLASSEDGMHVSDVAKRLKKPLGPTTALMKRLLDTGQVVKLDRGKYRVFARLYARYAAQRG